MSLYLDNLRERYDKLTPAEREQFDDHALGVAAASAAAELDSYELEIMGSLYDEIEESYKNWGKMSGLSSGFPTLDQMMMGLVPGEVSVVAGATSQGKTALAINVAAELALRGIPVLFVTLEMTKVEAGTRFRHIMGENFFNGMMNIVFQKRDELDWRSIDGLMDNGVTKGGCKVVVIDHLHYFTRELRNPAEDLGNVTKEFKKNAIRHKVPVILISHTRKGSGHSDTATGINDLRGSSYIAQDADIVLMVERDRDLPSTLVVRLEKNRNRHGVDIGTEDYFDFSETKMTELNTIEKRAIQTARGLD